MIKHLFNVAALSLFLFTIFFTHSEGLWPIPKAEALDEDYCYGEPYKADGSPTLYPGGSVETNANCIFSSVNITATPTTVGYNTSTTIGWEIDLEGRSGIVCTSSGPWPGTGGAYGGTVQSNLLTSNSTFSIVCRQTNYNIIVAQDSVSVTVTSPSISVTLDPFNPSTIVAGQSSAISFTSTGADSCSGTGIWSGNLGATSATNHSTGVMNTPGTYTQSVTCTGPGGSATSVTRSLTVTAPPPPAPPAEPTFSASCTLQANGTYNIRLTWNSVGATNYPVRIEGPGAATNAQSTTGTYTSITGFGVTGDPAPTGTSYTFTGIPTGGSYQYWGHAWSSTGGWSTYNKRPVSCPIPAAINGMCGPAATNYAAGATSYSGALCSAGTASPASPAFPAQGGSSSWQCLGSGGGTTASCTATRSSASVTPPSAPTGLAATPAACDSGQVTLSWNAVSDALSYTLYRNGSQIYSGPLTSYTNSGLTLDTSYTYTVSVTTGAGPSAQSGGVTGTAPSCAPVGTAPATPTSFTANNGACATGRISLNWSDVIGAESYELQRSLSSTGSFTTIYNGVSSAYSDTGLSPDTIYYYRVRAKNSSFGNSSYTATVSEISPAATCPPPPPTPTGLTGTPGACSSNSINLSWDPAPDATRYNLYRDGSHVWSGNVTSRLDRDTRRIVPGATLTYTVDAENGGGSSLPSGPITVSAPVECDRADLVSQGLSVTGTFYEDQPLNLSATVRNIGEVAAGSFEDDFTYQWNRTDGTWNPITTIVKTGGLVVNESSQDSTTFTPTQSGTLYIQHCVDSDRDIEEGANENPNCSVSAGYRVDRPDSCGGQTVSNCDLNGGTSGQNVVGTCDTGYRGSCNYTCEDGAWDTPSENSCSGPSIVTYRVCTVSTGLCTNAPGPHIVATGTPLRIDWTSNADNCQQYNSASDFSTGNVASGSDNVVASSATNATTTYNIMCRYGGNNTTAARRTLYVYTAVPGPVLTALSTVRQGSAVRLNWNTNSGNETSCTLTGGGINGAAALGNGTGTNTTGYIDVTINGRTTFTLTCNGQTSVKTIEIIPATWES